MPVDAGIALVGAGIAIYGAVKKNQDAKKAAANVMPNYNIPQSEYDNQRLAEANAGQGMSDASRTAYNNQSNDALSAGIGSIERSGGDPNAISNLYNNYSKGAGQLAIYDDQRRLQNLNTLMGQNQRMSANTDKSWQVNNYAPWANRAQALALKQQGDAQLISQGIGLGGQGLIGAAKSFNSGDDNDSTLATQIAANKANPPSNLGSDYTFSQSQPPQGTQDYSIPQSQIPATPSAYLPVDATNNVTTWGNGTNYGEDNNKNNLLTTPPPVSSPVSATNNFTTWGNGSGWGWNGVMPVQQ